MLARNLMYKVKASLSGSLNAQLLNRQNLILVSCGQKYIVSRSIYLAPRVRPPHKYYASECVKGPFLESPETFRARKAKAKSRTLRLQSCFIRIFLI